MEMEAGLAPRPALTVLAFSPFPFSVFVDQQFPAQRQDENRDLEDAFYYFKHPAHLLSDIY